MSLPKYMFALKVCGAPDDTGPIPVCNLNIFPRIREFWIAFTKQARDSLLGQHHSWN